MEYQKIELVIHFGRYKGCTIITSVNFVVSNKFKNSRGGRIYQNGKYTYSCMLQKYSISFTMYYNTINICYRKNICIFWKFQNFILENFAINIFLIYHYLFQIYISNSRKREEICFSSSMVFINKFSQH